VLLWSFGCCGSSNKAPIEGSFEAHEYVLHFFIFPAISSNWTAFAAEVSEAHGLEQAKELVKAEISAHFAASFFLSSCSALKKGTDHTRAVFLETIQMFSAKKKKKLPCAICF
jgi:hypothetical protein